MIKAQRDPFRNTEGQRVQNPAYERSCYHCTYVSMVPDGSANGKIAFEGLLERVDYNDPKCNDPFEGTERTCKSDVCMKIERTWHDQRIIIRRCADPVRNPCVQKWDEVDRYQRTIVDCCEAQLCNKSKRPQLQYVHLVVALFSIFYIIVQNKFF